MRFPALLLVVFYVWIPWFMFCLFSEAQWCPSSRFMKQRETLIELRCSNPNCRIRSAEQLGPRMNLGQTLAYFLFCKMHT